MKQKIYIIDWVDSMSDTGWKHSSQLEQVEYPIARCQTIGFFVNETKEYITLALNRDLIGGNCPYGDLISIPKVAIKRKKKL